jgi:hypothetical protein
MRTIRILFVVLTVAAAISLLAAPLAAQTTDADSSRSFVVLTGRIDVLRGEVFQDAVIFDGDATVDGQVVRNVVAFNGDVTVSGSVGENVVALNGRVTLGAGARVGGDVVSSDPAVISEDASVGGQVTSKGLPTDFSVGRYVTISRVAIWFATSLSSLVLGLLLLGFAPRAGESVARTASDRFGRSVGIGLAVFFGLPIAAFVAFVTIVGIPLGLGILLALALLFWIGYVSAALAIGRLLVRPPTSRLLAYLAGWAILRVVAIVPGLGGIAWFLATVFGLGALAVAARAAGRSRDDEQVVVGGAVAMPPPPPMPPL